MPLLLIGALGHTGVLTPLLKARNEDLATAHERTKSFFCMGLPIKY